MVRGIRKVGWRRVFRIGAACAGVLLCSGGILQARPARTTQAASAQAPAAARPVGTIKSISGNSITLTTDAGSEVTIVVQDAAKLVRIAPGQKDLKDAAPIQLQDLLAGDRILVRGQLADDGKTVLATAVIAMKKADIAEKRAREREEWQKHGTAGLVSNIDGGSNTITVALPVIGEKKTVAVHISKETILRRYAPDSVKFDDAKPAPLGEIKVGDQLRARGTASADGSELTAAEIVSGTFRNIAGTISAIDAKTNSITVQDLATKKAVTVKVSPESQARKMPPPMAQRIAARLKGAPGDAAGSGGAGTPSGAGANASSNPNANGSQTARAAGPSSGGTGASGSGGGRGGGGDMQQAILRMPAVTLAEFQKGDAVMIVATEGSPTSEPLVITLLGGVEPILEASPKSSASSILSPWSLGSEPGGEAGNP